MKKQSNPFAFKEKPYRSKKPSEIESDIRKISITLRDLRRTIGLRIERMQSGNSMPISQEESSDLITKIRQMKGEAAKVELELDKMMEVQGQSESGYFDKKLDKRRKTNAK